MECTNCKETSRKYTMKLIFTNRQDLTYPKFIPQIKELCANCGRYIKFAKQTEKLIDNFNRELEKITI